MAIPDYQTVMLPLLQRLADGAAHRLSDIRDDLENHFELSEAERKELLPSGGSMVFHGRVGWARTYLRKAGLLDLPTRGSMQITERGKQVLAERPTRIDVGYLKRFPEFIEFHTTKRETPTQEPLDAAENSKTPEEILDGAYEQVRSTISQELLAKVQSLTWMDFERLVVQLLVRMGYGGSVKDAGRALTKGGDEGIDGTIKEDKLGLDVIYIQAKKWQTSNTVGRPEIQKFVGALAGQGAKKGIFITTSSFSKEAREYQPRNETKIVLIDGEELTQLMIDHDLGVTTQRTYAVKRIDSDFFGEE
ncbi:MAG: restriction endonuclease [Flavobacteriales bacterium]|nr:restriction endonuclease [Flavobacteriales bacterium]